MRQPRLCDRLTLQELARLQPLSLAVTVRAAPLSTGTLVIPDSEPETEVGQFVELFGEKGSLGYYRICAAERRFRDGLRTRELSLEHAISTLASDMIFGGLTFAAGAQSAGAVLEALLRRQTVRYWTLWTDSDREGDLRYLTERKDGFYFENTDLLAALLDWQAVLPRETFFIFDMSRFPWRILPQALPTGTDSEVRLNRGAVSFSLSFDWSTLATRLYPLGAGSGEEAVTIAGAAENTGGRPYLDSPNTARWGIVSRIWQDSACTDADTLYRKAVKQLARVSSPRVTLRIDAR